MFDRASQGFRGSSAGARFHLQCGADECGPFPHARQPETRFTLRVFRRVESDAVVLDHQHDAITLQPEHHVHAARVRVLGDIVESLLRDPVERELGVA